MLRITTPQTIEAASKLVQARVGSIAFLHKGNEVAAGSVLELPLWQAQELQATGRVQIVGTIEAVTPLTGT